MTHLTNLVTRALSAVVVAAALGACSGSGAGEGSSSLITGSLFTGAAKPAAKVDEPASRPGKVAMISAAAVKCGFYFDPAKLRQSFVASQATSVPGSDPVKVQQTYDAAFSRASTALASQNDFCTPGQVADIKSDLNRHLAGDFTIVAKVDKGPKQQTAWEWLVDGGQKADNAKMDPNAIFFPSGGAQTTMER